MGGRPYCKLLTVASLGEGRKWKWGWGQGDLARFYCSFIFRRQVLQFHGLIAYVNIFFCYARNTGMFLDLKCLPVVTPVLQNILVGFVEFYLAFSFFIKSWEKHLWRLFLRPTLLILEQSHCLSTASSDILSHFPRSGSREGVWSQCDSPLKKQFSSLHSVSSEWGKCAIFPFYSKCPSVCVLRLGESASWQKCATSILCKKN